MKSLRQNTWHVWNAIITASVEKVCDRSSSFCSVWPRLLPRLLDKLRWNCLSPWTSVGSDTLFRLRQWSFCCAPDWVWQELMLCLSPFGVRPVGRFFCNSCAVYSCRRHSFDCCHKGPSRCSSKLWCQILGEQPFNRRSKVSLLEDYL